MVPAYVAPRAVYSSPVHTVHRWLLSQTSGELYCKIRGGHHHRRPHYDPDINTWWWMFISGGNQSFRGVHRAIYCSTSAKPRSKMQKGITSLFKKAQKRLYILWRDNILVNLYRGATESILTGNITHWHGSSKPRTGRLYSGWFKPLEHHWYRLQNISDISTVRYLHRAKRYYKTTRTHPQSVHPAVIWQKIQYLLTNQQTTEQLHSTGWGSWIHHQRSIFQYGWRHSNIVSLFKPLWFKKWQ